jgi:hypothetical protein
MPFTPIHMGAGLLIKPLMLRGFSLMVFGWSQIAMDIQPLVNMILGIYPIHGISHTYIGATLIAIFCGYTGKYLGEFGLKLIKEESYLPISFKVAFTSAFVGTLINDHNSSRDSVAPRINHMTEFNNNLCEDSLNIILNYMSICG